MRRGGELSLVNSRAKNRGSELTVNPIEPAVPSAALSPDDLFDLVVRRGLRLRSGVRTGLAPYHP